MKTLAKVYGQIVDRIERPTSDDRHHGNGFGTPNFYASPLNFEFSHRLAALAKPKSSARICGNDLKSPLPISSKSCGLRATNGISDFPQQSILFGSQYAFENQPVRCMVTSEHGAFELQSLKKYFHFLK